MITRKYPKKVIILPRKGQKDLYKESSTTSPLAVGVLVWTSDD